MKQVAPGEFSFVKIHWFKGVTGYERFSASGATFPVFLGHRVYIEHPQGVSTYPFYGGHPMGTPYTTYTYGVLGYIKEQLPKGGGVEMGWVLTHGMMVCCIKYNISPRKTGKVAPEAENRSHPVTPLN